MPWSGTRLSFVQHRLQASVDEPALPGVVVAQGQPDLLRAAVGHPQRAGDENPGVFARAEGLSELRDPGAGIALPEQLAGSGPVDVERLVEDRLVPRGEGFEDQPSGLRGVDARETPGLHRAGTVRPGDAFGQAGERGGVERHVVFDAVDLEQGLLAAPGKEGYAGAREPSAGGVEAVFAARVALEDRAVAQVVALAEVSLRRAGDRQVERLPLVAQVVAGAVVRAGELLFEQQQLARVDQQAQHARCTGRAGEDHAVTRRIEPLVDVPAVAEHLAARFFDPPEELRRVDGLQREGYELVERVGVVEMLACGGADAQLDADAPHPLHRGDGLHEAVAGGPGRGVEPDGEGDGDDGRGREGAREDADPAAAGGAARGCGRGLRCRGGGLCGGLAAECVHQPGFEPLGYGDVVLRGDGLQRPACGAERLGACGAFGGVCLHPAAHGGGKFAGEQLVQLFEEEAAVHILFGFHGVRFLQVLHQFLQPFDAVVEPRLDGRRGQLERLGNLGEAQRGEGVQADDLGLLFRQAVEQRGDPLGLLAQRGFPVVGRELRPERFEDRVPAFPVAAGVGHAAVEVGAEVGDLAPGGQQPQKGLLHDVLGIALRPGPQRREAVQLGVVVRDGPGDPVRQGCVRVFHVACFSF